jgi:hypothetical protein
MRALLTITHHDAANESYVIECPHGLTRVETASVSGEPRQRLIAGLLARHGSPSSCTCAAETDLVDAYPSVDSAVAQIMTGAGNGLTDLDDESIEEVLRHVRGARCPSCSIAVKVMPLHLPADVVSVHDPRCPLAVADDRP